MGQDIGRRLRPLLLGLMISAGGAMPLAAQSYYPVLPSDPVAPRSMQQCRDVLQQYRDLADGLQPQITAAHAQCLAAGADYNQVHLDHQRLLDQASAYRREGNQAFERCSAQVRAHEREERLRAEEERREQEARRAAEIEREAAARAHQTSDAMAGLRGESLGQLGLPAARGAARELSDRFPSLRSSGADLLTRGLRISGNVDRMSGLFSDDPFQRLESGGLLGAEGLLLAKRLNPLSGFLTKLSISGIIDINRAGMADLEAAFANFEAETQAEFLRARLDDQSAFVYRLASEDPLQAPVAHEDLQAGFERVVDLVERSYAERVKPSRTAVRQAAAARAAERQASRGSSSSSGRGGGGYASMSCSALRTLAHNAWNDAVDAGSGKCDPPWVNTIEAACRAFNAKGCYRPGVSSCTSETMMCLKHMWQ